MPNELTRIHDVPQQYIAPPPQHSFDQLVRMAASFAKSGLFGVKDADSALSLLLIAQSEGLHPAKVMRDFDVIQGRLAKKSEAMLRDFQASGGKVEWQELTDTRAAATFSHPLSPKPLLIDWDIPRAEKAGLLKKTDSMYLKYARAMLRSRCISEGVRATAPGATSQMYTPEEIRQIQEDTPAAEPVSIQEAVTAAVEQVKAEIPEEELDAMIGTLDVKTLPELVTAFGRAYTKCKTVGDEHAMKKLKSNYDAMKEAIESGTI
jgi:hypothetical protein